MDESTPLFAFHAYQAIGRGQLHEAVELCAHGISQFPDYLSGYVVLAKAYDALGMTTDARLIRSAAAERFVGLAPAKSDAPDQSDVPDVPDQSDAPDVPEQPDVPAVSVPQVLPSASHSMQSLRLVTMVPATEGRVIRAASVRLIPGLDSPR